MTGAGRPVALSLTAIWLGAAAMIVAAWFVAWGTPDRDAATAPFVVAAHPGAPAEGRNIAATITDARLAAGTVSDGGGWQATGTWLVVFLDAEAVESESGATLSHAVLRVGERTYQASERPQSLYRAPLSVGIPRSGTLAFELPDAVAGDAVLSLGLSIDPRLDSVIELPVDLSGLERESSVEWTRPDWTHPPEGERR